MRSCALYFENQDAFETGFGKAENMKRDMKRWLEEWQAAPVKKAFPVLSFPAIQLMGINVKDLISDAGAQAKGMKLVAERTDSVASVSLMDLSVEAECFGAKIRVSEDEVPTGRGAGNPADRKRAHRAVYRRDQTGGTGDHGPSGICGRDRALLSGRASDGCDRDHDFVL